MRFSYQAKTKEGELQVGFVEAANQDAAAAILGGHDLFILKLDAEGKEAWYAPLLRWFGGVKSRDLVIFTRQLATLLESHLSLEKALTMLYEQTENTTLKEAVYQVSQDVASGLAFSQALERHETIFTRFFVSMIRSAEVTGRLSEVAGFLADYTEQEAILISKARSALIYPAILFGLFGVVAFVMITVVFPQIGPIFEDSGVTLPLFSRVLIGTGTFLSTFWPLVLLILLVLVVMVIEYLSTNEGRAVLDDAKVRLPVLWRIYVPITLTRFGNASGMLIRGGIPLAQAMEIVSDTIDNAVYQDILQKVANDVRQGRMLSDSLAEHTDYFPVIVSQMVAVGEVSGQLDQIFERITAFYKREADAVVNNLVDLIQPILLIIVGLMVGIMFASILLPLYQLTGTIQ
jgi:type IV pilus assembly protein PilC